jgi:hypothetical protein
VSVRRILGTFSFLAIALTCGAQSGAETKNVWDSLTGFPAYVGMQTYHLPVVASVMGKPYVFFEIYVLNAYESAIDVSQLATYANGKRVEALRGKDLASSMQPVGRLSAAPPSHTIAAAETAVFFVALPFASVRDVPHLIQNELTLSVRKAGAHVFTVKQAVLRVNSKAPIAIEPPLRGNGWFAGNGPANASIHRRTIFYFNGRPYLGQRFAIDWLQGKLDRGHLVFYHGNVKKNSDWYCWNQPVYAVGDGVVVGEKMDLPENVPNEPPVVKVTQNTIGGNYLVIGLGSGRFAFYAHLRPHSATVRVGDRVKAGQIVGRLGNSGNSSAPHLHFHVTDAPQFIFSDGEPYAFATLRAAQSSVNEARPDDGATVSSALRTYRNTMPGDGAIVDFGSR